MSSKKPKILFIGGYGRSGSTLLDRVLGQIDGFCSVGELRYLLTRGIAEARLCGCGKPVPKCAFWGTALAKMGISNISRRALDELISLQASVDRIRYIPHIMIPLIRTRKYSKNLREYTDLLLQLISTLAELFGCEVLVDSSKDPSHGFVLSEIDGIDLRLLHLVRDSRAVAYSWQRKKRNLEVKDRVVYMRRLHPIESAIMWSLSNTLTELLSRRVNYYVRLKYEELTADPENATKYALEKLGFSAWRDLPFVNNNTINISKLTHNISGNPSKFSMGNVIIREDKEWIKMLSLKYKYIVTTLTLPWLLKYGYLPNRTHGDDS